MNYLSLKMIALRGAWWKTQHCFLNMEVLIFEAEIYQMPTFSVGLLPVFTGMLLALLLVFTSPSPPLSHQVYSTSPA